MRRHLIRSGATMLAAAVLAGCAADHSVRGVEDLLIDGYLEPLDEAGIAVTVADACRYADDITAPWHLSIALRLDAPEDRVARLLEDDGMVVRTDREPMIVQQIPGNPDDGWNGSLAATGERSVLTLVFNNAERSGWHGTVGWSDSCAATVGQT